MKKYTLTAQKRDLVGRKVKNLRKQGLTPATVYGKDVKSLSLAVSHDAFTNIYAKAGETGLVELSVDGDLPAGRQDVRPVLIHTVQKDPVKNNLLHVEFYQVDLKEKVHANVPVEFVGEAPAHTNKTGVLLTIADEVEVEALPTDLPEKLVVDVSVLAEVDNEVKVKDLTVPHGVTILTDPEQSLIRVGSLVSKEAEAQAVADEAAAAAASAEAAPAGETPAEGAPAEKAPEVKEDLPAQAGKKAE